MKPFQTSSDPHKALISTQMAIQVIEPFKNDPHQSSKVNNRSDGVYKRLVGLQTALQTSSDYTNQLKHLYVKVLVIYIG